MRALVDEFRPALMRFAKRQGAGDPEAVVNTALFDAVRNLDSFRGEDRRAFRSYLYRITRRRVADEFRRGSRQPHTVGELNPEASEVIDIEASSFDDRVVDEQIIDEFLGRLTEEQREVLEMRVMTGLSIRETATRTGRSEVAVKAMQRRALLSLRTLVVTAAVLLVGFLAFRVLSGLGDGVVVVENGPADSGVGDDGLVSGVGTPVEEQGAVVVQTDEPARGSGDGVIETATATTTEPEAGAGGGDEGDSAESSDQADPANGKDDGDADTPPSSEKPPETTTTVAPVPTTPCNVYTDGSPEAGEIAVVDYDFSGPYTFLVGTSVALVGPKGEPNPILNGYGDRNKVGDGDGFPFVITPNMLVDDKLTVESRLAQGKLTTTCDNQRERLKAPCVALHDGSPKAEEKALIRFKAVVPYAEMFKDKPAWVAGVDNTSVMVGAPKPEFVNNYEQQFTLKPPMLDGKKPTVRVAFGDGRGFASCAVRVDSNK